MLQPTRVFYDEVTRQNQMRWLSGYSFRRTNAMLEALRSCGHTAADPSVHQLWPSTVEGEARHITIPSTAFRKRLDEAITTIQTNSVLHMCSAFEAAIDGMYQLAVLYSPQAVDARWNGQGLPLAISSKVSLDPLQALADRHVRDDTTRLKGKYSKRLASLCAKFHLAPSPHAATLDAHYANRNLIAHDQSLPLSSNPMLSYSDILKQRMSISESDWKSMLACFRECVGHLDSELCSKVVRDEGLCIAIHETVVAHGPLTMGRLRDRLTRYWGLARSNHELLVAAQSLGLIIGNEKAITRRTVTK